MLKQFFLNYKLQFSINGTTTLVKLLFLRIILSNNQMHKQL